MAELFGVKVPAINKHLKNIFESEELQERSVISILETTQKQGMATTRKIRAVQGTISISETVQQKELSV